MLSRNLEIGLHRALSAASERRHEYATLEHLLLSLLDDKDVGIVLRACNVTIKGLRADIIRFLDNDLSGLATDRSGDPKPTAGFQRVVQRAAICVQQGARDEVTCADVLYAINSEHESHAMYFLTQHGASSEALTTAMRRFGHVQNARLPPDRTPLPKKAPKPGPGSTFVVTTSGFELKPRIPARREHIEATQNILHASIKNRINNLRKMTLRISNTHPALTAELSAYAEFVCGDLAEIDVASLWSIGNCLSEIVRELGEPRLGQYMTEPLEPDILAQLRSLTRDHAAFILGFSLGRRLLARAQALRDIDRPQEDIRKETVAILRPMATTGDLLAPSASRLVRYSYECPRGASGERVRTSCRRPRDRKEWADFVW